MYNDPCREDADHTRAFFEEEIRLVPFAIASALEAQKHRAFEGISGLSREPFVGLPGLAEADAQYEWFSIAAWTMLVIFNFHLSRFFSEQRVVVGEPDVSEQSRCLLVPGVLCSTCRG